MRQSHSKLSIFAILFIVVIIGCSTFLPAFASEVKVKPITTQATWASTATIGTKQYNSDGMIIVTNSSGTMIINVSNQTLFEAMAEYNLSPENFRTEDKKPLTDGLVDDDNVIFIFELEYTGSLEKIVIPAPVEKIISPKMHTGSSVVLEPGENGIAITTKILETDTSGNKTLNEQATAVSPENLTETLSVIKKPKTKVVLVGSNPLSTTTSLEKIKYPKESSTCALAPITDPRVDNNIKLIHEDVCKKFPEIVSYGTIRAGCTHGCDHADGLAMDIMVSGDRGWEVAEYLRHTYKKYNIDYIIYQQSIWNPEYFLQGYRPMEDRGSITQNHFDHVHVSVFSGNNIQFPHNIKLL